MIALTAALERTKSWSVEQDFHINGFYIIESAEDPTNIVDGDSPPIPTIVLAHPKFKH
jgi:hypothetical protein